MNGRAALFIFLFFVVMLSACNTQADIQLGYSPLYQVNTMDDTIGNDLQNILDTAVAEYELPAIQAAVIMDNNSRWTGISGTTNYSRKRQRL